VQDKRRNASSARVSRGTAYIATARQLRPELNFYPSLLSLVEFIISLQRRIKRHFMRKTTRDRPGRNQLHGRRSGRQKIYLTLYVTILKRFLDHEKTAEDDFLMF